MQKISGHFPFSQHSHTDIFLFFIKLNHDCDDNFRKYATHCGITLRIDTGKILTASGTRVALDALVKSDLVESVSFSQKVTLC